MAKILLDTSFLIDIFRFGIDKSELDDYQLFTVQGVVKELEKLSKGAEKKYARLALKWLETVDAKVVESEQSRTDDMIVDVAGRGYMVATSDRELRKRLKGLGVKIIYIRARKHLELS